MAHPGVLMEHMYHPFGGAFKSHVLLFAMLRVAVRTWSDTKKMKSGCHDRILTLLRLFVKHVQYRPDVLWYVHSAHDESHLLLDMVFKRLIDAYVIVTT